MSIKKIIKHRVKYLFENIGSYYLCKYHGFPNNCQIHYRAKILETTCEGNNKIYGNTHIYKCEIGYGTCIAPKAFFSCCKIGRYCAIGGDLLIGEHPLHKIASIHPALYSTMGQFGFTYVTKTKFAEHKYVDLDKRYHCIIGNDAWVTSGSKIIEGVIIGDGAVVMTGAIVTKDVPPYAIVGGIPARIIGYRFTPEQISFLLKLKWWDKGEEWIRKHADYFEDIEKLIEMVEFEEGVYTNG